jgi:hypothetical protein
VGYQQNGEAAALEGARSLIAATQSLPDDDRARLLGFSAGWRAAAAGSWSSRRRC